MKSESVKAVKLGYVYGEACYRARVSRPIKSYTASALTTLLTLPDTSITQMDCSQSLLWAVDENIDDVYLSSALKFVYGIEDDRLQIQALANIASVYLLQLMLLDIDPHTYFERVWQFCSGINPHFEMTMRRIGHVFGWGSYRHALRHLGDGSQADSIVSIALYSIMKHEQDLFKALAIVEQVPRNRDCIMRTTGALMTARLGMNAIPETWRETHLALL